MGEFYSANPYRGCEFGCLYCYARYTHEFLDRPAPEDFARRVYVKTRAPEIFARDLKRAPHLASGIHLGSATDPFQPAEARYRLTHRMLEALLPHRGIPLTIATKGSLVAREADLLAELSRRHFLKVIATCVTLDPALGSALEPNAPSTEDRLRALALLNERGVEVGVLLAPVLPGLNDSEEHLERLCRRARDVGARSVISQVLFLPDASKRTFFPWLASTHPTLYERYRKAYRARQLEGPYKEVLERRVERARAKAGFGGSGFR